MYRGDEANLRQDESDGDADATRCFSVRKRSRQWTNAVLRLRPLSIDEAAKAARCRRGDLEKRIEQGDLPFIQRGSRRYIRQEDLQKMLENEAQVSPMSGRRRLGGNGCPARINLDKIDPRLRRFFN